jgi:hypothetical protein
MNAGALHVRREGRVESRARRVLAVTLMCAIASVLPAAVRAGGPKGPSPLRQTDAQVLAAFEKRVADYCALLKKVEDSLPLLPTPGTAQEIDKVLQDLRRGIVAARAGAQAGDVFAPETRKYLRRVLARVFSGPDRARLRDSILRDNPVALQVRVNGPYPDSMPVSTMPPEVLEVLPTLPGPLEFRFVGRRLILYDRDARLVVDWVDRALPKV